MGASGDITMAMAASSTHLKGVHRGTQGALERLETQGFGVSKQGGLFMLFPFPLDQCMVHSSNLT